MSELKPCQCDLNLLNDRILNLGSGLATMPENGTMQVNKAFLTAVLGYMEELLGMRRAQPANEPLTLDELREMSEQNEFCGAHIWIKDLNNGWIAAAITDETAKDGIVGVWCAGANDVYCEKDYGVTWLAYRSEPKEEHNETD